MTWLFLVFAVLLFLPRLMVMAIFEWSFTRKVEWGNPMPKVSILIPARNEEANIANCLQSLLAVNYPIEQLEILVGNDQSTDDTASIAKGFASEHEHISVHQIEQEYHGLVARSNVLAQLAKKAKGDLLVFLDADMKVDTHWLTGMVIPAENGHALVSGFTEVKAQSMIASFQKMDWLNVIFLLKSAAEIGQPGTALGNNMLVNREVYESVGGYEAIGPTYTEDNDLSLAIKKKGGRLFQVFSQHKAITQPMEGFAELLKQRNRWLQGAFKQPLWTLLPLLFSRIFVLWGLLFAIADPLMGLSLIILMTLLEMTTSLMAHSKSNTKIGLLIAFLAPVFNSVLDTFTLLSYPWNKQVVWKGRKL